MEPQRSSRTLFVAAFLFAVLVAGCFQISCYDIWWQLKAGDVILSEGFPDRNVFSHSEPNGEWESEEWLFEVVVEAWRRVFGLGGVVLFRGLMLSLAYLFLFLAARRKGARVTVTLWLLALSVMAGRERWFARPQIVTYVLAAVFLYLATLPRRRSDYVLFPALMILWVNSHPAFVLGCVILGAGMLEQLWHLFPRRTEEKGTREVTRILPYALLIALCLGATLVNPHGWKVYHYVLSVSQSADVKSNIAEWVTPRWAEMTLYAKVLAVLCIAALPGLLLIRRRRGEGGRIGFSDFALTLFSLVLFFTARRHLELLALLPIPGMASLVSYLTVSVATWKASGERLYKCCAVRLSLRFILCILPAIIVLMAAFTWERPWGFTSNWRLYPREGVNCIRQANLKGHIFNSYRFGGYLLYELYPDHRAFIDGRPYVYSDALFQDYRMVINAGTDWMSVLDKYEINTLFLAYETGWGSEEYGSLPHALAASGRFALVSWDDTCMVYARRIPEHQAQIERDEYRGVIPSDEGAEWLSADHALQIRALDELNRKIEADPYSAKAHRIAGNILSQMGRDDEAETAFRKAIAIRAKDSASHNSLGVFYAERRRWEQARKEFETAIRYAPLDTASRVNLARLLVIVGDTAGARKIVKRILSLEPDNPEATQMLGLLAN